MAKKARFALMNWKTRMGSLRSPVRTRPLPLPRYRAPGAVAGSPAADGSAPHARHWSGRHVGSLHRDRPVAPSSRSPGRSARTRAIAPLVFAQIGPDQPSVAGIPAHRVGDSSASMAPPSQVKGCPPNRVNSKQAARTAWDQREAEGDRLKVFAFGRPLCTEPRLEMTLRMSGVPGCIAGQNTSLQRFAGVRPDPIN